MLVVIVRFSGRPPEGPVSGGVPGAHEGQKEKGGHGAHSGVPPSSRGPLHSAMYVYTELVYRSHTVGMFGYPQSLPLETMVQ